MIIRLIKYACVLYALSYCGWKCKFVFFANWVLLDLKKTHYFNNQILYDLYVSSSFLLISGRIQWIEVYRVSSESWRLHATTRLPLQQLIFESCSRKFDANSQIGDKSKQSRFHHRLENIKYTNCQSKCLHNAKLFVKGTMW